MMQQMKGIHRMNTKNEKKKVREYLVFLCPITIGKKSDQKRGRRAAQGGASTFKELGSTTRPTPESGESSPLAVIVMLLLIIITPLDTEVVAGQERPFRQRPSRPTTDLHRKRHDELLRILFSLTKNKRPTPTPPLLRLPCPSSRPSVPPPMMSPRPTTSR